MDNATFKAAQALKGRIDKIKDFLGTVENMRSLCVGYGTSETPETTAKIKQLLREDLEQQLKKTEEEFLAL